jgi:hypothetical protein
MGFSLTLLSSQCIQLIIVLQLICLLIEKIGEGSTAHVLHRQNKGSK